MCDSLCSRRRTPHHARAHVHVSVLMVLLLHARMRVYVWVCVHMNVCDIGAQPLMNQQFMSPTASQR